MMSQLALNVKSSLVTHCLFGTSGKVRKNPSARRALHRKFHIIKHQESTPRSCRGLYNDPRKIVLGLCRSHCSGETGAGPSSGRHWPANAGKFSPAFHYVGKPRPCRQSLRCESSDKEEASTLRKEEVADEDDFSGLSLEDVVKDVVAARLEQSDTAKVEVDELHQSSHRDPHGFKASIDNGNKVQHNTGGAQDHPQDGERGLKIDVAPNVLEILKGTGELEGTSLFDLVEEKRKKKLAESNKATAEQNSVRSRFRAAFSGLKLEKWLGSSSGGDKKEELSASRKSVNYMMDLDYVEKTPVQKIVEEAAELGDLTDLEDFGESMGDINLNSVLFSTANTDFTMVSKVLPFIRDCMTGVNGQSLETMPTPLAELIIEVANGKERTGVSGKDLEALGLASSSKTVDSQSLQREIFRSGPFYAQWFERWQNGWVVTGYLEGNPAEVRRRLQARLDQHFPELQLVVFLLNTPQEVPWCLIIPASEPVGFTFLPKLRQAVFASAVVSALVMWICKGMAVADPLLLKGEDAAIALAALPLGLLTILFTGSIARSAVASLYGVRDRFPIPLPMPGLGAIGMTAPFRGVLPNRSALIDIPLAGSLATAAASIAMITSSHSWLAQRFPQQGPLILVPPETLHHSYVLSFLVAQLQKASVVGADDIVYMAIHPLAFAGLLGLNATALSLLPIAGMDGGRIVQGLFGRDTSTLAREASYALLFIGLIFGDTSLSLALLLYPVSVSSQDEWYQRDEVTDVGFLRTLIAFTTMAMGMIVLSPTLSWIPFHSLVKEANTVQTLLPTWGNL